MIRGGLKWKRAPCWWKWHQQNWVSNLSVSSYTCLTGPEVSCNKEWTASESTGQREAPGPQEAWERYLQLLFLPSETKADHTRTLNISVRNKTKLYFFESANVPILDSNFEHSGPHIFYKTRLQSVSFMYLSQIFDSKMLWSNLR